MVRGALRALAACALLAGAALAQDGGDKNGGFDHRAHAVPGGPYVGYAAEGATAQVALNGGRSHSHFYDPASGATGSITAYAWTAPELLAAPLCAAVRCDVAFPRGVHRLVLSVSDNTNSTAVAETSVSVLAEELPGLRSWFSVAPSAAELPDAKPVLSATVPRVGDGAVSDGTQVSAGAFPAGFDGQTAQVQYFGKIDVPAGAAGLAQFRIRCSGDAPGGYCYASIGTGGGAVVVQGTTGGSSKTVTLVKGLVSVYASATRNEVKASTDFVSLEWRRPTGQWGAVPSTVLVHVPVAFAPVLNYVSPGEAKPGDVLKLSGTGFSGPALGVSVGQNGASCSSVAVESDSRLTCVLPAVSTGENVPIWVTTANGMSNNKTLSVGGGAATGVGYYQDPAFYHTHLRPSADSDEPYQTNQVTSITIGPDQRYYLGALNGYVHVLTVGDKESGDPHVVTSQCTSDHLGDERAVLGVAFNPAEFPAVKLYASVSQLYWEERYNLSRKTAWRNGAIVTFEPQEDACLKLTNPGLVTGLPVSNHDHGVNGIQFDDDGVLFVTVGGSTNGGKSVIGDLIGGAPDSPLSGAMLRIPVLKPGFNGAVKYTKPEDPATTDVVTSPPEDAADVTRFADGLRNAYSHVIHSNGLHYAMDNGANEGFGDFSNGCGENEVRPSKHDGDPLRLVTDGSFQGYANMNRGRYDERQCLHRELTSPASEGYDVQMAYFDGSTSGMLEYTSNTFGGAMRSNLMLTKFAIEDPGATYRVVLSQDGKSVESQYEIAQYSGLSAVLMPHGGIAMPRVWQGHVAVLGASETNPGIVTVSAVTPMRGPKAGGNRVMVTGWNLSPPLTATFGGEPCTDVDDFAVDGRSFMCTVPPGEGKVPVVVVAGKKSSKSWGWEYGYMNI